MDQHHGRAVASYFVPDVDTVCSAIRHGPIHLRMASTRGRSYARSLGLARTSTRTKTQHSRELRALLATSNLPPNVSRLIGRFHLRRLRDFKALAFSFVVLT